MVKGVAIETVLLLWQCPPALAENYAVAVRDMNTGLRSSKSCFLEQNKLPSSFLLYSHSLMPVTSLASPTAGRGR
jgi:hypothetical protein